MFLAGSFLIFISEESVFTDFDSLLGLLVVIQSSFILSDIGSFIFQKVAFMERAEELGYYKKQWPKIQVISYFMALTIFTLTSSLDVIVVLVTVFLIVTNTVIRAYFASIRMLKVNVYTATDKGAFFW